jgi:acyl-CoA reductase-like NAD-dependent aldehyde dehydrogenase
MKTYGHFIDGAYVEPVGGKHIDSFNPYSGEVWARIGQGCADDAGRAEVRRCRPIFPAGSSWSRRFLPT